MGNLLKKPTAASGKVHDITPETANWGYVGFGLYRLKPGESASEYTGDTEVILVLVEGKAEIASGDVSFRRIASIFPPAANGRPPPRPIARSRSAPRRQSRAVKRR